VANYLVSATVRYFKFRKMSKKKNKKTAEEQIEKTEVVNDTEQREQTETTDQEVEQPDREAELEAQVAAMNDKYLRLYAEFDNFRRRTAKQQIELQKTAGSDTIREILPVLDDFDRAIESNKEISDPEELKKGFELIYNKFKGTLQKNGLKEIDAKEKPFDTDLHEAITNVPAPSEEMKGKVVDVVEKGYYLNDQVLRFSKVVVGQ